MNRIGAVLDQTVVPCAPDQGDEKAEDMGLDEGERKERARRQRELQSVWIMGQLLAFG